MVNKKKSIENAYNIIFVSSILGLVLILVAKYLINEFTINNRNTIGLAITAIFSCPFLPWKRRILVIDESVDAQAGEMREKMVDRFWGFGNQVRLAGIIAGAMNSL